jgi:sugar/nucleoside kinase (ribokinase family)
MTWEGKFMEFKAPLFLIAGNLSRDFIILPSGDVILDVPGGSALYAAVGLAIWQPDPPPGLVARVGEDYPQVWLERFQQRGIDVRGVNVLPQALDVRSFAALENWEIRKSEDPVQHFARLGLSFPKGLLGYRSDKHQLDSRTNLLPNSLRQADIPEVFLDATVVHICPLDYMTHSVLPAILRQAQFTLVTLDPSTGYMNPTFWGEVPALLTGLTAFLPSEEEVRTLFQGRSTDIWEMAEGLAAYGCEFIVIKAGARGQLLFDAETGSRWEVPPYPARIVNTIGAGDAFCGGFVAGYRLTYDPLMAVLYGNISASLVIEGNDPLYALDCLPELPQARLESLRQAIHKL